METVPVKKILIVDDDHDILEALKMIFELSFYDVTTLADGELVVKTAKELDPDAIILDVLLSGYDGREICKKLKARHETRDIPIIMISAHPDAAISTINAGANAFLPKPFDMYELMNKVDSLFV